MSIAVGRTLFGAAYVLEERMGYRPKVCWTVWDAGYQIVEALRECAGVKKVSGAGRVTPTEGYTETPWMDAVMVEFESGVVLSIEFFPEGGWEAVKASEEAKRG